MLQFRCIDFTEQTISNEQTKYKEYQPKRQNCLIKVNDCLDLKILYRWKYSIFQKSHYNILQYIDRHKGMIQKYKKQGLDQAQNQFICTQRGIFLRGIPPSLIISTKVQLQHFMCKICNNVIWKAVACSQPNCFANFCQYCVSNYSQNNQKDINEEQQNEDLACSKCPKCNKAFHKTSIPLINNLLSELKIRCFFHKDGCKQEIPYDSYLKHCLKCDFRSMFCAKYLEIQCEGCKKNYLHKDIKQHMNVCSYIVVQCPKCGLKLPQAQFKQKHTEIKCLQVQLQKKTSHIGRLQEKVQNLKDRLNQYQVPMQKIIKGQNMQLPYQLYSSFPTNFNFNGSQVKVSRSSWNANKQKYDFLHFYVTSSIKTESPVGYQWKLLVKVLKGNLLIGICSSLMKNSVDFVINRFGQIKKKQSAENKYKLIRKGNLTFSQGDIIGFKYLALRRMLKIQNQTKKVECMLQAKQIMQLGDNLYSFYSLDTANDTIKFI